MRIGYKNLDLKYFGILQYCEEMQRYPQIALYGYTKGTYTQDLINESIEDYTGDMAKFVLLDTSKADYIEFISTNEKRKSEKRQKCFIKRLLSLRTKIRKPKLAEEIGDNSGGDVSIPK